MTEALRVYLDEIEEKDEFREALIDHYLADEIEFDVLTEFLNRQNAEAVRSSKAILNQGDYLADEMSDR